MSVRTNRYRLLLIVFYITRDNFTYKLYRTDGEKKECANDHFRPDEFFFFPKVSNKKAVEKKVFEARKFEWIRS